MAKVNRGPIINQLKELIAEMERGDYNESAAAVLITEDKGSGLVTCSHMTEQGIDRNRKLFAKTARLYGYAKLT